MLVGRHADKMRLRVACQTGIRPRRTKRRECRGRRRRSVHTWAACIRSRSKWYQNTVYGIQLTGPHRFHSDLGGRERGYTSSFFVVRWVPSLIVRSTAGGEPRLLGGQFKFRGNQCFSQLSRITTRLQKRQRVSTPATSSRTSCISEIVPTRVTGYHGR